MQRPTWILVADRARARLFSTASGEGALAEVDDFVNPEGRMQGRELESDKPPRAFESVGTHRHAMEPETTSREKVAERFARELRDALERGRVDHRFEDLVLVAPPEFLGTLNQALGKELLEHVVATSDKNLTALGADELRDRLAGTLGAARKH